MKPADRPLVAMISRMPSSVVAVAFPLRIRTMSMAEYRCAFGVGETCQPRHLERRKARTSSTRSFSS